MTKPWYKSLTILGGLAAGIIQVFEASGIITPGMMPALGQIAAGLIALYGLRRAIPPV